jgi:hypothetical protein
VGQNFRPERESYYLNDCALLACIPSKVAFILASLDSARSLAMSQARAITPFCARIRHARMAPVKGVPRLSHGAYVPIPLGVTSARPTVVLSRKLH